MKGFQSLQWIEWNLLLAAIPAALGYLIAAGIERWTIRNPNLTHLVSSGPFLVTISARTAENWSKSHSETFCFWRLIFVFVVC